MAISKPLSSNDALLASQARQLLTAYLKDPEVDRLDEALGYAAKIQLPSTRSNIITDIALVMIGNEQFDRANLIMNVHHFKNDPEAYTREQKKINSLFDQILQSGCLDKIRPLSAAFHANDQVLISRYLQAKALELVMDNQVNTAIYIAAEIPSESVQEETLHAISANRQK